jgi:hypothetical protein
MALLCVTSVRAAPGASTLAVLAAACWPRPVALLEADPAGGALAVRYRLGRQPGLAGLAAAVRHEAPADALWANAQMLPGDLPVVVAPESGEVTTGILRDAGGVLAQWCRDLEEIDVIVDCGRLGVRDVTWPLVTSADEVLLVTRPRAEELYPVAHRVRSISAEVRSAGLVLIGDRPHGPGEIQQQLGVEVHGVVADDPRAAGVLTFGGSSRGLRRSSLVRSVRTFVDDLVAKLDLPIPAPTALDAGAQPAGAIGDGKRGGWTPAGALGSGTAPFPPPPPLPPGGHGGPSTTPSRGVPAVTPGAPVGAPTGPPPAYMERSGAAAVARGPMGGRPPHSTGATPVVDPAAGPYPGQEMPSGVPGVGDGSRYPPPPGRGRPGPGRPGSGGPPIRPHTTRVGPPGGHREER